VSDVEIRAPADDTEGTRLTVLRWLKRIGEPVARNEPLLEIETDKVTVEVAAPGTGVLTEILKAEQDEVSPGELLGRLDSAPASPRADGGQASPSHGRQPAADAPPAQNAPLARQVSAVPPVASGSGGASLPLSPAVRRLLGERGLAAAAVTGTGPGGRITVEDVLRAAGQAAQPIAAAAPAGSASVSEESTAAVRRVPHSAVRRRIAEHMVQSLLHTAPHVTTVFETDMSAVLGHRAHAREEFARRGAPLTLTAYFVQAAVAAIRAVPEANSRWTDTALEIYPSVHLGIATAVEGVGLIVPVLRDAQSRDLFGTARALEELVSRARGGALSPAEVRGGTFTLSNHGVSGSLLAAPIVINQPQSAILGIGKLEKRAVVLEEQGVEQIAVRPRCYVSLTLDHRVMDGERANHFMRVFVQTLEQWPA
jgi:2-oxoglutarate dehydrogenase E2 component (dihydrolipoamide succinyltransferase)